MFSDTKSKKRLVGKWVPFEKFYSTSMAFFLKLTILYLCFIITGFVCTNGKGGEEECSTSQNTLCYECDSRFDPNCADPFDFSPTATLEPQAPQLPQTSTTAAPKVPESNTSIENATNNLDKNDNRQASSIELVNKFNSTSPNGTSNSLLVRQPKKYPPVAVCHGCCVKITSRMIDGGIYVKRTCTTNLQINFFMVGLVCMKESGDRGKMCFCDNDYCNGQLSLISSLPPSFMLFLSTIVAISFYASFPSRKSLFGFSWNV